MVFILGGMSLGCFSLGAGFVRAEVPLIVLRALMGVGERSLTMRLFDCLILPLLAVRRCSYCSIRTPYDYSHVSGSCCPVGCHISFCGSGSDGKR